MLDRATWMQALLVTAVGDAETLFQLLLEHDTGRQEPESSPLRRHNPSIRALRISVADATELHETYGITVLPHLTLLDVALERDHEVKSLRGLPYRRRTLLLPSSWRVSAATASMRPAWKRCLSHRNKNNSGRVPILSSKPFGDYTLVGGAFALSATLESFAPALENR
eukprot:1976525-Pleurochrysis_carterae.AAC.4